MQCNAGVVTQHTNKEGSLQSKHITENLAEQHKPKKQNSQHHHTTPHSTEHKLEHSYTTSTYLNLALHGVARVNS